MVAGYIMLPRGLLAGAPFNGPRETALLSAAKTATKEEQLRSLREHAASRAAPRPQPVARDPLNDFETVERQVDALMAAWNRALGPRLVSAFWPRSTIPLPTTQPL